MIQRDNTPIFKAYFGTQPIYNIIATEQSVGGGGIDFSAIGYTAEDTEAANQRIQQDIEYSTLLYLNWDESNANTYFSGDKQLVYCPNVDTSNVTNMSNMFNDCTSLQSIPLLNTSNVTKMWNMFNDCELLKTIPLIDTSNVTNMDDMFYRCDNLQTIPLLNTSNVTDMAGMFSFCYSLITIPQLNTSNVEFASAMFCHCTKLQSLPLLDFNQVKYISQFFGSGSNITEDDYLYQLTDLGGFADLNIDWNDNYGLALCPSLTYESIMNVINNLYDFRANGESTTRTLKIHSNTYSLLSSEDIAVATNKGWIISH